MTNAITHSAIDLSRILSKYSNEWVVLSNDEKRVIGHGKDIKTAIERANKMGEKDPIVTRVPKSYGTYIL